MVIETIWQVDRFKPNHTKRFYLNITNWKKASTSKYCNMSVNNHAKSTSQCHKLMLVQCYKSGDTFFSAETFIYYFFLRYPSAECIDRLHSTVKRLLESQIEIELCFWEKITHDFVHGLWNKHVGQKLTRRTVMVKYTIDNKLLTW